MPPSELEKNIITTVIYCGELNLPLTSFEIWKYLIAIKKDNGAEGNLNISLANIVTALEGNSIKGYISYYRGFYFPRGKKGLVEARIKNEKISSSKIKKLRKIAWLLRFIPFVRMVLVTGRLAMKNAESSSDWDLLIALKSGRIWTGRTLVTAAVHLMGKRRVGDKIKDRVCLNYFITDDSLEIRNKDLFSSGEYFFTFPLFGEKLFRTFQLKNSWIKNYRSNYGIAEINDLRLIKESKFSKVLRIVGEKLLGWDFIENSLQSIEKKKIMNNPKTHQEGSLIEASSDALTFLPDPQGPKVFEKFKGKIATINLE